MTDIDRRRLLRLAATGAVVGATGLGLAGCTSGSDQTGSSTPDGDGEQGATSSGTTGDTGAEFVAPDEILSVDGVLDVTLTAAAATVPFGDGTRFALTYEGSTPGPTLRLRPGDLLRVRLVNRLDSPTNLHTHGLHVSPTGNSDNIFLSIDPGDELLYEIQLPDDHPGGTFWYHPHRHGFVAEQVGGGLAGMIIVDGPGDDDPALASATERVMVLSDPRLGDDEGVLAVTRRDLMRGREGDVVTVNGVEAPVIRARAGTLERWRLVNASPARFHLLRLEGAPLVLAANDVGLIRDPVVLDELLLAPGERAELLVPAAESGDVVLRSHPYTRAGGMGMGRGMGGGAATDEPVDLVILRTEGASAAVALPGPVAGVDELVVPTPESSRTLELSMGGMGGGGMTFMIDGRIFDPERTDTAVRLGTVEEWTVTNVSGMDHPFHLHVWPFHVVDASDPALVAPGRKDTVNVPAGGWVRLVVPFDDYDGRTVYHCHILDHEDQGMMGVIEAGA